MANIQILKFKKKKKTQHATHLLKDKVYEYEMDPISIVEDTELHDMHWNT